MEKTVLGTCPKCGGDFIDGKFGPYCESKCGFTCKKIRGHEVTKSELKTLLGGGEVLLKELTSKNGNSYDLYVKPTGIEPYSFTSEEGNEISGYKFQLDTRFPEKEES